MDTALINKLKNNEKPFGLLTIEEQLVLIGIGHTACQIWTAMCRWIDRTMPVGNTFNNAIVYRIKPDYQPEPETQNTLIGKTVIVFDRYHFALPIKGWIEAVAEKDGAYQIAFYSGQHGYPNYLSMNHKYFFSQQCQIVKDDSVPQPEYDFALEWGVKTLQVKIVR